VPIYEYKCPQGHVFELFQRMSDPPPAGCEVCGEGPVERVLYPVAVHFKGSGFYSTDYGRGGRKREDGSKDGAAPATTEPKKDKTEKTAEASS
jgi:putative FmdB family regulatory protein